MRVRNNQEASGRQACPDTYSTRQVRPSFSISRSASTGPHVPAWYSGTTVVRLVPSFQNLGNPGPGRFNGVAPHEPRGITGHHVQEQPFIGFRRRAAEDIAVLKIHFYRMCLRAGARHARDDAEREPFFRLDTSTLTRSAVGAAVHWR